MFENITVISKMINDLDENIVESYLDDRLCSISIQVNKDTKIKYNDEEVELKKTTILTREDVMSNVKIYALEESVKFYITIRYYEN